MKWKSCYSHFISKETEAQRLRHLLRLSQPSGSCEAGSSALPLMPGAAGEGGGRGAGARAGRSREQVHH